MPEIKLYGVWKSPFVRGVAMTLEVIGKEYELVPTDVQKNEHVAPEYLEVIS